MKRVITLAVVAFLVVVGLVAVGVGTAEATPDKVTICHATGSESNPFVQISPSAAGVYNGHLGAGHQNGEDIIPPFEYKGQTYSQNWDAAGQAIYNNGCEPVATEEPTDPPTTDEPTDEPTETPEQPEPVVEVFEDSVYNCGDNFETLVVTTQTTPYILVDGEWVFGETVTEQQFYDVLHPFEPCGGKNNSDDPKGPDNSDSPDKGRKNVPVPTVVTAGI